MPVTMDADSMSVLVDLLHKIWILLHILPDQKERGADLVLCQHLQYLRRVLRVRTIVEGQRDLAAGTISLPQDGGIFFLLSAIEAEAKRVSHLEHAEDAVYAGFRYVAELAVDRQHGRIA